MPGMVVGQGLMVWMDSSLAAATPARNVQKIRGVEGEKRENFPYPASTPSEERRRPMLPAHPPAKSAPTNPGGSVISMYWLAEYMRAAAL